MLISLDNLLKRFEEQRAQSKFDLRDMQLIEPGAPDEIIKAAEGRLVVKFPIDFYRLLKRFDFSRLSLANLIFEYGHDLEKLVKANLGDPVSWWKGTKRPSNLLLIGTTDGHAIFMSLDNGTITATEKRAANVKEIISIANSFEELVRMAGSLALGHSKSERIKIALTLSSTPFWTQLAKGTA